jgi:hypothetical protein
LIGPGVTMIVGGGDVRPIDSAITMAAMRTASSTMRGDSVMSRMPVR